MNCTGYPSWFDDLDDYFDCPYDPKDCTNCEYQCDEKGDEV